MMLLDTTSDFQTALRRATSLGTGCLVVDDATGTRSGRIFLRDGRVYSVLVDGFLPKIAQRLRTGGMVDDDGLRNLLAECGNDPYASDAGEKAVIAGMVGSDVLQAVHRELLLSSIGAMRAWDEPRVKFKRQVETARFVISAVSVEAILRALDRRAERWAALWREIAPGAAVEDVFPSAAREPADPSNSLSFEAEAVAAVADGTRSVDEVAGECGLTRFETGHVLAELVAAGRASVSYVGGADTGSGEVADRSTRAVPPADGGQPVSPEAYLEVPSPGRRPEVTVGTADAEPSATGFADPGRPIGHEPATGPGSMGLDHVEPPAGPVINDHADDDELSGPRLAPDVLAANEHVGDLEATDDGDTNDHDDLPAWGDPVDDLPDGLYFEPVAIDMPDVVFEAVADGVSNRSTETEQPAEQPAEQPGEQPGNESGDDSSDLSAAPGSGDPHPDPDGGSEPPEGPPEDALPAAVTAEASDTGALAVPTGPADLVAALDIPDAMPTCDTTLRWAPEAGAAGSAEGHGAGAMLPLAPPVPTAGAARLLDAPGQPETADSGSSRTPAGEDAGALAAAEAERIAAAEAVRVEAEAQAEDRDERRAALDRASAALTAAQAEADRSEIACEELLTSRTRVEESVDRLAEAVTVAEDEVTFLEAAATQALERLQHVAAAEDEARADLAAAEAALAAAQAAHEAAVDRLDATVSSRADLDARAELAAADHRQATERTARLKAEEQLARDAAAVSVKAHAAAVMLAAAAKDSVAEAALRVERARSRLEELD